MTLSEHAERNRTFWGGQAASYADAGRRNWQRSEPCWGIFELDESAVGGIGELSRFAGKEVIELGCGTAYWSAWLTRAGARVTGIDITPEQLATARELQREHGLEFTLLEASAEAVPLPDESFDLAISEYGASIWCEPRAWLSEAARLLRPGGELVFMVNSPLLMACIPADGETVDTKLHRPLHGMHRFEWPDEDDDSVEFHLNHADMIRLLGELGFVVEALVEPRPPAGAKNSYTWIDAEWARNWPAEEIWRARKR